ncbi:hypothetical protein IWZ03DRAFT_316862 [Phyllosticta citriasiana]|uniref:DUF1279 domain-containing protein n=1 Tax=Phyllosticta citriasiana TaxID=595635 RepID=A0ABR1KEU1_9PEZI
MNLFRSSRALPALRRPLPSAASSTSASAQIRSLFFRPRQFSSPAHLLLRSRPSPLLRLRNSTFRRFKSDNASKSPKPDPTPNLGSPQPAPSFSQRMRKLSREYGWVALGVYLGLSVLDFPFCFLAVRMLGTDRIGRWEHAVIQGFWDLVHVAFPDLHKGQPKAEEVLTPTEAGHVEDGAAHRVDEANKSNTGDEATIWTQLALAYAIHKSFIFIRVPLTAAVTPKVVKVLRRWGWDIGKKKPKA